MRSEDFHKISKEEEVSKNLTNIHTAFQEKDKAKGVYEKCKLELQKKESELEKREAEENKKKFWEKKNNLEVDKKNIKEEEKNLEAKKNAFKDAQRKIEGLAATINDNVYYNNISTIFSLIPLEINDVKGVFKSQLRDTLEDDILTRISCASIQNNVKEVERLALVVNQNGYDINKPIQLGELKYPPFFFIAAFDPPLKYRNGKDKDLDLDHLKKDEIKILKDKAKIAQFFKGIKGFKPNIVIILNLEGEYLGTAHYQNINTIAKYGSKPVSFNTELERMRSGYMYMFSYDSDNNYAYKEMQRISKDILGVGKDDDGKEITFETKNSVDEKAQTLVEPAIKVRERSKSAPPPRNSSSLKNAGKMGDISPKKKEEDSSSNDRRKTHEVKNRGANGTASPSTPEFTFNPPASHVIETRRRSQFSLNIKVSKEVTLEQTYLTPPTEEGAGQNSRKSKIRKVKEVELDVTQTRRKSSRRTFISADGRAEKRKDSFADEKVVIITADRADFKTPEKSLSQSGKSTPDSGSSNSSPTPAHVIGLPIRRTSGANKNTPDRRFATEKMRESTRNLFADHNVSDHATRVRSASYTPRPTQEKQKLVPEIKLPPAYNEAHNEAQETEVGGTSKVNSVVETLLKNKGLSLSDTIPSRRNSSKRPLPRTDNTKSHLEQLKDRDEKRTSDAAGKESPR